MPDGDLDRSAIPLPDSVPPPGFAPRAFALVALVCTVGGLAWLAVAVGRLFVDSWVAPIELSPDNDAVLELDLQLTRQRAEMERVRAEIARVDAEVVAIDAGLERLETLRHRNEGLFDYGARRSAAEEASLGRVIEGLREERRILERLVERQRSEVSLAESHLAAGLVERRDLEGQRQSLDGLLLERVANERALEEAQLRRSRARDATRQLAASAHGERGGRLPEIVERLEADTRLELEILRLQAERRGLVATRELGRRSLDELGGVLEELSSRPVYRATRERMTVAFVPYAQLDGVRAGARVVRCTLGIFACRDVGSIVETLPGEVVTQDPWGELARGRYAVLELSDRDAVQERILRVR